MLMPTCSIFVNHKRPEMRIIKREILQFKLDNYSHADDLQLYPAAANTALNHVTRFKVKLRICIVCSANEFVIYWLLMVILCIMLVRNRSTKLVPK